MCPSLLQCVEGPVLYYICLNMDR